MGWGRYGGRKLCKRRMNWLDACFSVMLYAGTTGLSINSSSSRTRGQRRRRFPVHSKAQQALPPPPLYEYVVTYRTDPCAPGSLRRRIGGRSSPGATNPPNPQQRPCRYRHSTGTAIPTLLLVSCSLQSLQPRIGLTLVSAAQGDPLLPLQVILASLVRTVLCTGCIDPSLTHLDGLGILGSPILGKGRELRPASAISQARTCRRPKQTGRPDQVACPGSSFRAPFPNSAGV